MPGCGKKRRLPDFGTADDPIDDIEKSFALGFGQFLAHGQVVGFANDLGQVDLDGLPGNQVYFGKYFDGRRVESGAKGETKVNQAEPVAGTVFVEQQRIIDIGRQG